MAGLRPQYHLRRTPRGIDAFDVRRLIRLSADLPVRSIDPRTVAELDEDHWYFHTDALPTPRSVLQHLVLIRACDPSHPVILDAQGRLMDGMHRICRALLDGVERVPAVRFVVDPAPDFVDCDPRALPYDG
jgi:hypothetical protein